MSLPTVLRFRTNERRDSWRLQKKAERKAEVAKTAAGASMMGAGMGMGGMMDPMGMSGMGGMGMGGMSGMGMGGMDSMGMGGGMGMGMGGGCMAETDAEDEHKITSELDDALL